MLFLRQQRKSYSVASLSSGTEAEWAGRRFPQGTAGGSQAGARMVVRPAGAVQAHEKTPNPLWIERFLLWWD